MEVEGLKVPPPIDTRLSYSSSTLLSNCEQRYSYYKIEKVAEDKDAASRDKSHFNIGTSFHYILEESLHEKPKDIIKDLDYCVQEIGLKEEDRALVHAQVIKYLRLRKDSPLKVVGCEYAIKNPIIIGYIDAIEVDPKTGDWYISDLKTAASFYDSKIAELPSNQQLNLYCSFSKEIAEAYNLDPDKFMGARYLVATKSKAKQKKSETYNEFVMRLADTSAVKAIFVTIPKEMMRIEETRAEIEALHVRSLELRAGECPTRNYSYCNAFFSSCQYFSRCHGKENSEMMEDVKIVVERL